MSVPGGWVRLQLEDFGQHSAVAAYPALRYSTVQYSTVQYLQYSIFRTVRYSTPTSSSATRWRLGTWRCSGGCPRHHQPRRRGEWGSSCRIIQRRCGSSLLYFIPVPCRLQERHKLFSKYFLISDPKADSAKRVREGCLHVRHGPVALQLPVR